MSIWKRVIISFSFVFLLSISAYAYEISDEEWEKDWDFWGICWESDSYNIWIQSADIGTFCYVFQDGQ